MAFKVTYEQLNSQNIPQAMHKLHTSPLSPKTAVKVSKIKKTIDEEIETARKAYQTMLKEHVELDENGNPVFDNGDFKFKEGGKELFQAAYDEFKKIDFEVSQQKIYLPELDKVLMSAQEIESLEFCIEL